MDLSPDMEAGEPAPAVNTGQIEERPAGSRRGGIFALADRGDWRTILLMGATYGLWIGLVFFLPQWFSSWPGALVAIVLIAPVLTLHSSLQHEFLHGHPFRAQRFNDLVASFPVALSFAYPRFKATHLQHHQDNNLCDPYDDPESWYLDAGDWLKQNRVWQAVLNMNNTFAGRLLLGPAIGLVGMVRRDFRTGYENGAWLPGQWFAHWILCGFILTAVHMWSNLSIPVYLAACYLGVSLLMVRTYAEHQSEVAEGAGADGQPAIRRGRSIIVENGGIFAFLFLNNSLHQVHHAAPAEAWYRLPKRYRENRERFQQMNRGYTVKNYRELFRAYAFRRKEPVPYPGAWHDGERTDRGTRG